MLLYSIVKFDPTGTYITSEAKKAPEEKRQREIWTGDARKKCMYPHFFKTES